MRRFFDEWTFGGCRSGGLALMASTAIALWSAGPSRADEVKADAPAADEAKPAEKEKEEKPAGDTKKDEKKVSAAEQLGFRQAEVTAEMAELEQRMFRLGETLKSLEPENSSRLMLGLKFAREELVLHQMKEIQEQLEKASLGESLIEQKQLLSKLERLEQLLLSADLDFQMRLQRLRQIREILRRLEPVIREEDREQKLSDATAAREAKAAELAAMRAKLEDLIHRQTAHLDRSRSLGKDPASAESKTGWTELATEQGTTQEQTAALAGVTDIGVTAPGAAPAEEKPAAAAKPAEAEKPAVEEKPAGEEKPAEEKAATEEKPAAEKKPAAPAKAAAEAPAADDKAAVLQTIAEAAGQMRAAKGKLDGKEPATAEPDVEQALATLKRALADLEQQQAALQSELKAEKFVSMAKDQSANRQSTDSIDEMVRGLGDSGAAALAELIKSGGNMSHAEGDLRGMQAGTAGKEQEMALASLKYARELLAEEANRLQNQLRAEVKKRVLEGLIIMLDEQVVIRQSTESLSERVAKKSRQAEAAVIGLSRSEVKVIALADELVNLVEETEFGIALPAATRIIRDQMDGVRDQLAAALAGEEVIAAEKQIEGDLQSLIDAMKQMPSAGRDRGDRKGRARNEDEQRRELNRLIAELKMVRLLETRLYETTTAADGQRAGAANLSSALRRQIMDLTGRQEDVRDVTERLAIERGQELGQQTKDIAHENARGRGKDKTMPRMIFTIVAGAALGLFAAFGSALAQDGTEIDPLLEVAADMNAAALKLAKLHTDTPTQTAQKNALKKLDEIITRLEEEEKRQGTGPGKRPARESTITQGPGGMGTLHAERREGKQWAELPAKERERILQSMNDGFPSHYQKILEGYFARLADEKPLADAEPAAGAAPAAAADAPTDKKDAK